MLKFNCKKLFCLLLCGVMSLSYLSVNAEEEITDYSDFFNTDSTTEESEYCNLDYEKYVSSNAGSLFVNSKSGRFYFEDRTGTRWYSNPDMADKDEGTSGIYKMELQSLLLIGYQDITKKQYSKANSETGSVRAGSAKVNKTENGFEAVYTFEQFGFTVPVEISLDNSGLKAFIDVKKIKETKPDKYLLCSVSLLPYFGAGGPDEQGSIIVADGSGCEMDFNNGRYSKLGYSSHIYGSNLSKYVLAKEMSSYPIMLPVYGIKRQGSAVTAIVTDGAAIGTVWCYPNGSISSYANVYTTFALRETDSIVLNEYSSSATSAQLYQKSAIKCNKVSVSYVFLSGEDADYGGMARAYKKYLCDKEGLSLKSQSIAETSLDFYGAVKKKRVVLGFPVMANTALSKIDDIEAFINRLGNDKITDVSVTLRDWSNEQLAGKLDYSLKPTKTVGTRKELINLSESLKKNGGELYLGASVLKFKKSGKGYNAWFDSAKALNNAPIYCYSFYNSNYQKNTSVSRYALIVPSKIEKITKSIFKNNNYGEVGISLGETSVNLYSDFNKKSEYSTEDTMNAIKECVNGLKNAKLSFDSPADYALKAASLAQRIPETSSQNDIFDRDIPFTQLVLSGIVPYTCEPINLSTNERTAVLNAAAYGGRLQFDLITEDSYTVTGTELDRLYCSNSAELYDAVKKYSEYFKELGKLLGEGYMTNYFIADNVSISTYSNGAKVTVDRLKYTVKVERDGAEYGFGV